MSAEKLNGTDYEVCVNSVTLLDGGAVRVQDVFIGEGVDGLWRKAPIDKKRELQ